MIPPELSNSESDLELKLDSNDVGLGQLVAASSIFSAFLREITSTYLGSDKAVDWVVSAQPGSVRLLVRPVPSSPRVTDGQVQDLNDVVTRGLAALAYRGSRPEFFSNRALGQLKSLANLSREDLPISIGRSARFSRLSKETMANVDHLLGRPRDSLGSVEGTLESINIHGSRQFAVFDAVSGARAECYFGDRLELAALGAAIGRRVAVRGQITTRSDGTKHVQVSSFRPFAHERELPSADDVRGILRTAS